MRVLLIIGVVNCAYVVVNGFYVGISIACNSVGMIVGKCVFVDFGGVELRSGYLVQFASVGVLCGCWWAGWVCGGIWNLEVYGLLDSGCVRSRRGRRRRGGGGWGVCE